jgi:hypothetical protein
LRTERAANHAAIVTAFFSTEHPADVAAIRETHGATVRAALITA